VCNGLCKLGRPDVRPGKTKTSAQQQRKIRGSVALPDVIFLWRWFGTYTLGTFGPGGDPGKPGAAQKYG